jgi:hypothetical protein
MRLTTLRWVEFALIISKHLMCYDVEIPHSEDDNPARRASMTVSKLPEPKVIKEVKDKQQAVIELLLLEGCTGEEIMMHLRNVYGSSAYCRASAFRLVSEVGRGNKELRNPGGLGRSDQHEIDTAIRSIQQENPNTPLRTITKTLLISPETVRAHTVISKTTCRTIASRPVSPAP